MCIRDRAYRETLRRKVLKAEYTHKKQSGGSGQYGKVIMDVEPLPAGSGYEFVNAVTGGRIPREYIPAVDAGIKDAMQFGVLAGYPVEDVRVTLTDGAYHDVDSSELALKPAILNASSEESTSWYAPSVSVTRTSSTGYPARTPNCMASLMPASTAGMYSRGIR